MATGVVASSPLKKKSGSLQQRSTNSNTISGNQSTRVVTRSMAKAAAATATKRTVAVASLHSDNTGSNINDGVGKSLLVDPLKEKSTSTLKMKQQSPFLEVEDYYSNDSPASPPNKVVFPQSEAELSQIVIMPAMMIGVVNLEEELVSMEATLERLSKESAKKDSGLRDHHRQTF